METYTDKTKLFNTYAPLNVKPKREEARGRPGRCGTVDSVKDFFSNAPPEVISSQNSYLCPFEPRECGQKDRSNNPGLHAPSPPPLPRSGLTLLGPLMVTICPTGCKLFVFQLHTRYHHKRLKDLTTNLHTSLR